MASTTTTALTTTTTTLAPYLTFVEFEPQILEGVGNAVVDIPEYVQSIVRAHHDGAGEFSVYTLDPTGARMGGSSTAPAESTGRTRSDGACWIGCS